MTLLNSAAIFAAAAVVVPILIHLQKRRKSKVVDWPAMQFLKRTVTSRRRGLTLEHLVLLFLRCLLVLLFALAMARPVIESGRHLSKVMFFLIAGCGLLLLTAALVGSTWRLRNRFAGVAVAVLLFGGAGAMLSASPESLVDRTVDRDVVIVIDSSSTMTLGDDEASHFDGAISQAQSLVETLSGNSTVSIVVAGPLTEAVDGSPFRNLRKAEQVLGTLSPIAGGADMESAIRKANSLLKKGLNARKQILLLTDDQLCTWESIDEMRLTGHSFVTDPVKSVFHTDDGIGVEGVDENEKNSESKVACAAIVASLPAKTENVSVDRLLISSSLVTANRPIPIEVEIRNGGSTTIQDVAVKLLVDGRETASESLIQIEPEVSSTVRFLHAFLKGGQHIVSGTVEIADKLSEDNRLDSVVDVIPNLSILLVNGSPDANPTQQSATFAQLALDPASLREPRMVGDNGDATKANADRAIVTTTIDATRLDEIESLENFQLIMLCDVPRLPVNAAERVANFVEAGGGLWIIPGEHTDVSFYNTWRGPLSEERVMPAEMSEWDRWVGEASPDGRVSRLGIALDVAGQPFVSALFEQSGHDLADISFSYFWKTTPSESAIVGMRLTNGEPLYTEHAYGRGRVLMQNVSLTQRDSNFPGNLGFPVLVHLWSYHLAASNGMASNFEPTSDLVTELATRIDVTEKIEKLQLVEPGGTKRDIPISWKQDVPFARIGHVARPGIYQLRDMQTGARVSSFAIHRDREESNLSVASEDRLQEISQGLGIALIDDVNQLTSPVATRSAGTEIWNTLLFIVLWLLAAECLVTRWIRSRRGITPIETSASRSADVPMPASPLVTAAESSSRWSNPFVEDSLAISGRASQ